MSHKIKKAIVIAAVGTLGFGAITTIAEPLSVKLEAVYNNIRVKVNGAYKTAQNQPFMVNGSVYVSLRDVGEMIGSQVDWDGANQTVEIQTGGANSSELEAEVAQKNFQIATLQSENKKLLEKIAMYEENDTDEDEDDDKDDTKLTDLDAIQEMIEDDYGTDYSVDWDFELSKVGTRLKLEVDYDGDTDHKDFANISETKLETFLENILDDIQYAYDDSIEVYGDVYDKDDQEVRAEFKIDEDGDVSVVIKDNYSFDSSDLSDYEDDLEDTYKLLPRLALESFSEVIRIDEIELDKSGDTVHYKVHTSYPNGGSYDSQWDHLGSRDESTLEDFMSDIASDIEDEFNVDDVEGTLYNEDEDVLARYEDGEIDM